MFIIGSSKASGRKNLMTLGNAWYSSEEHKNNLLTKPKYWVKKYMKIHTEKMYFLASTTFLDNRILIFNWHISWNPWLISVFYEFLQEKSTTKAIILLFKGCVCRLPNVALNINAFPEPEITYRLVLILQPRKLTIKKQFLRATTGE